MIYHIGSLSGWPYTLSVSFNKKNIPSINIARTSPDENLGSFSDDKGNIQVPNQRLKCEIVLFKKRDHKLFKLYKAIQLIFQIIHKAKIVHYHGETILPGNVDAYIFKLFKIPMVMTWGGSDTRITSEAIKYNPYFWTYNDSFTDKEIKKRLIRLSRSNVSIATDPETAIYSKPYFKKIYLFRAPINMEKMNTYLHNFQNKIPQILHCPTRPILKGTVHFESAVQKLKSKGFQFEYKRIFNISQEELYKEIAKCDIYLDELRVGSHGVTALEACSLGKPTLVYIREDLVDKYPPEMPFVNANPDTVYDKLKELLLHPEKISEIGKRSREYVRKYHDTSVVINHLLSIYREMGVKV